MRFLIFQLFHAWRRRDGSIIFDLKRHLRGEYGMRIKWSCTLSYDDKEGFRCGVCYDFPVFDFLERRQLKLREFPLIVMEGSFTTYQNIGPFEMENKIDSLIKKVIRYKGNFVYLWHNSSFKVGKWREYDNIYSSTLLKNHDSIEIQKETF